MKGKYYFAELHRNEGCRRSQVANAPTFRTKIPKRLFDRMGEVCAARRMSYGHLVCVALEQYLALATKAHITISVTPQSAR